MHKTRNITKQQQPRTDNQSEQSTILTEITQMY